MPDAIIICSFLSQPTTLSDSNCGFYPVPMPVTGAEVDHLGPRLRVTLIGTELLKALVYAGQVATLVNRYQRTEASSSPQVHYCKQCYIRRCFLLLTGTDVPHKGRHVGTSFACSCIANPGTSTNSQHIWDIAIVTVE